MKTLLLLLLCVGGLNADSLHLRNNTAYTLKAVVHDFSGTRVGEFTLNAQSSTDWSSNEFGGTSNTDAPSPPYTVEWICMSGDAYGTCRNVAVGSVVLAQGCMGPQQCRPPKKKNDPETAHAESLHIEDPL